MRAYVDLDVFHNDELTTRFVVRTFLQNVFASTTIDRKLICAACDKLNAILKLWIRISRYHVAISTIIRECDVKFREEKVVDLKKMTLFNKEQSLPPSLDARIVCNELQDPVAIRSVGTQAAVNHQ